MLPGFTSDGVGTFAGAAGVPGGCAPARPAAANKARRQTHVRRIIDALPEKKTATRNYETGSCKRRKELDGGSTAAGPCWRHAARIAGARRHAVPPRAAQTAGVLADRAPDARARPRDDDRDVRRDRRHAAAPAAVRRSRPPR